MQQVRQKSSFSPVTCGAPLGSVLGPVLFTMFVNDIPSSPAFMFVDDTKIICYVRYIDNHAALQIDLNLLYEWSVRCQ